MVAVVQMEAIMSRWVRVYADILDDEKVAKMSLKTFKFFIFLLTYVAENDPEEKLKKSKSFQNNEQNDEQNDARNTLRDTLRNDRVPSDPKLICWRFRITKKTYDQCVKELLSLGIIYFENNDLVVANWSKRQYKSDLSTDRVKRFRERFRNVDETVYQSNRVHSTEKKKEKEKYKKKKKEESFTETADFLHTRDFYFLAGEKFYEAYPVKKDHDRVLEIFKAACKKNNLTSQGGVQSFLTTCLFAVRQQIAEHELKSKYGIPTPLWKYPVKWIENGCWQDSVQTAAEIRQEAITGGYYKPGLLEKLEQVATKNGGTNGNE